MYDIIEMSVEKNIILWTFFEDYIILLYGDNFFASYTSTVSIKMERW